MSILILPLTEPKPPKYIIREGGGGGGGGGGAPFSIRFTWTCSVFFFMTSGFAGTLSPLYQRPDFSPHSSQHCTSGRDELE